MKEADRNIVEISKIWEIDRGWKGKDIPTGGEVHPDLVRFKKHWYCGFKETGRSRIIRSSDGEKWETVKLMDWEGAFVGRPYLSITPEGALMIHTWIKPLNQVQCLPFSGPKQSCGTDDRLVAPVKRYYVTLLSLDGLNWGTVNSHEADLNFSVTWHNGVCYGVGPRSGTLFYSCDGKTWQTLNEKIFPDREAVLSNDPNDYANIPGTKRTACSETALYFDPHDDKAWALTRTNPVCAILGNSAGPRYQDWTWRDLRVDWDGDGRLVPARDAMGVQLGCPVMKNLIDGRVFGAGRADASDATGNRSLATLFWIDIDKAVLKVFAKLHGYGGYSGVVENNGVFWVVCSNNKAGEGYNVFLIKVKMP
jgi:YD repeat-containing protein